MFVRFPAAFAYAYSFAIIAHRATTKLGCITVWELVYLLHFQTLILFLFLFSLYAHSTITPCYFHSLFGMLARWWRRHLWRCRLTWEWDPKPWCLRSLMVHSVSDSVFTEEALFTFTWMIVFLSFYCTLVSGWAS